MREAQALVRKFHQEVAGAPTAPAVPMFRNPHLRATLIIEEAIETVYALVGSTAGHNLIQKQLLDAVQKALKNDGKPNIVEAIDGLCDTVVVCLGTAEDIGVELEPFYNEVMRSNLAKADGPVREDGKKLKPEGWTAPDIAGILSSLHSRA